MMYKVEAIISEERFEYVKKALQEIQIYGMTVSQVVGCGNQHGSSYNVRGSRVEIMLLPKIKIEIVVSNEECEQRVIDTIQKAAYTGNTGDGKIFSYEVRSARKIRTNEKDEDAIRSEGT